MSYKIVAKRLPLDPLQVTGHLYIDVYDDLGNRITQINGLATASDGTIHPTGGPNDFIKAYNDLNPSHNLSSSGSSESTNTHAGQLLFSGSQSEVEAALKYVDSAFQ